MNAGVVSRPTLRPFTDHGRRLMLTVTSHVKTQEMAQLLPAVVNGELKFIKFLSTANKKVAKAKVKVTMAKVKVTMAKVKVKLQVTMAKLQVTMAKVKVKKVKKVKKNGKDGQKHSNQ